MEDNVKLDLKESDWEGMGYLICFRVGGKWQVVVYVLMNLRVP